MTVYIAQVGLLAFFLRRMMPFSSLLTFILVGFFVTVAYLSIAYLINIHSVKEIIDNGISRINRLIRR